MSHSLRRTVSGVAAAAGAFLLVGGLPASGQAQTDITNFTKTNNIFTNLNEQYPHTGTGTPGSGVGTPNASFAFNPATYTSPNQVAGSNQTSNGVTFDLTSDSSGHDFTEINNLPGGALTIATGVPDVTSVSFLINSYFNPTASFTFMGSGGATETFSGVQLHDFNGSGIRNTSSIFNGSPTANFFDQTAFAVQDVGAGGTGNSTNGAFNTYVLDEDTFDLNSAFSSQTLSSITIQANGSNPILLGVTALGLPPNSPVPEGSFDLGLLFGGLALLGPLKMRLARLRRVV